MSSELRYITRGFELGMKNHYLSVDFDLYLKVLQRSTLEVSAVISQNKTILENSVI